ncbi:MAG: aldehyde dehydrogenase family protein [Deltaproteobacteria bacterium]|nr:aldehyde dehydrogenase family protein [Deltaproteobacteria bacterium]
MDVATNTTSAPKPEAKKNTFEVRNPATGEVIRELPIHGSAEVAERMARVRQAAKKWAQVPIAERCRRVLVARDVVARRMDDLAKTIVEESGKVAIEALTMDLGPTLLVMSYFGKHGAKILADEPIHLAVAKHRKSYVAYRPKGVIAAITPWNFPFFMPGSDVAMSFVAGNGVVLKPSEITPLSALALKDCYDEAGLDPELFQVVTGAGATGAALIEAGPDHVVFTGSVSIGRKIAVACAERLLPCTLELGGKAPAIVLDDANLDRTANALVWGGFSNAGQVCASVERVYAVPAVYDRLLEKVVERTKAIRVGDPRSDNSDLGSMTFPRQRENVVRLVEEARHRGARVLTGGALPEGPGLFYPPTVIADCTHDMAIMTSEIFGPAIPFMRVSDEHDAVRLANDSSLGLGAYVFTEDEARGRRVAEAIEVGSVMINDVVAHAGMPEMPWGGIKQSGLGVVRSDRGLKELCQQRHVNYGRVPTGWMSGDPWWYPYSPKLRDGLKRAFVALFGDSMGSRVIQKLIG